MDEARRSTLQILADLAESWDAGSCWDPQRAVRLLRSQSSPEEMREAGVSEDVIEHIWGSDR